MPAPEGAKIGEQSPTNVKVGVPLLVPAAVDYYLGKLAALGWQPVQPKTSENVTESFAQLSLGKDGYLSNIDGHAGQAETYHRLDSTRGESRYTDAAAN